LEEEMNLDILKKDILAYTDRGSKCALWGISADKMSIQELLGFIGFLDELIEIERKKLHKGEDY